MCGDNITIVEQFQTVLRHFLSFGGKSGDEIGANRRIATCRPDPLDRSDRVCATVAPLHPLENQVIAGLEGKMEVGKEPLLSSDEVEQGLVHLNSVERGESQSNKPRLGSEKALAELSKSSLIICDVDAGEDDLPRAAVDFAGNCITDELEWQRTAWPAGFPDRAEGAAMIASVLDSHEASHMTLKARWRHDVMCNEAAEFAGIFDDPADPWKSFEESSVKFGGAASHEDLRIWSPAVNSADRLASLANGLVGDGAAVDDDPVLAWGRRSSNRIALGEVQPAAKSDRLDAH